MYTKILVFVLMSVSSSLCFSWPPKVDDKLLTEAQRRYLNQITDKIDALEKDLSDLYEDEGNYDSPESWKILGRILTLELEILAKYKSILLSNLDENPLLDAEKYLRDFYYIDEPTEFILEVVSHLRTNTKNMLKDIIDNYFIHINSLSALAS